MKEWISRSRKTVFLNIALTMVLLEPIHSEAAAPQKTTPQDQPISFEDPQAQEEGYMINFNNVSIIEFIRFVSKIRNVNFVFDETELQFSVTIVSEDEISPKNIMSALVQVLRIHNLTLLEQDNNLLITGNKGVNQFPTIVSGDLPGSAPGKAPIITRVIRIKNTNPSSVANIIRPMMSQTSLVEVSNETNQLIVTDVTTNVEKIMEILASIDTPHSALEIESYEAKNTAPQELINLARQIVGPFIEGNPHILVPQTETNTIFIVSTPFLIERTVSILQDLDSPTKTAVGQKQILNQNIFVYKILHKDPNDLLLSLKQVSDELSQSGLSTTMRLSDALQNVKYIKESNSLLFIVDNDTLNRLKDILANLDVGGAPVQAPVKMTFIVYKILRANPQEMQNALSQMGSNLKGSGISDQGLLDAIKTMKFIKETNSLVFTGDPDSLQKLQDLLPTFDISSGKMAPEKATFFVYKIQHADPQLLESSLEQMTDNLKSSGVPDEGLIDALGSMKYLKDSNSLVFTGDQASLNKIQSLMPTFDIPGKIAPEKATFYVYKIQHADVQQLENSIDQMSSNLKSSGVPDEGLIDALGSVKYLKDSNSLVFTGDPTSLNKIQSLMPTFDISSGKMAPEKATFFVYKIQHADEQQLENSINQMAANLKSSGVPDEGLIDALESMKYLKDSNSLVFTGDPASLNKIQSLMPTFDIPGKIAPEKATFYVYKIQHADVQQLENSIDQMSSNLKSSGVPDEGLIDALGSVKYLKDSNSLVFTGDPTSLNKIQSLMPTFDISSGKMAPEKATFFVYKIQHADEQQLENSINQMAANLKSSGVPDEGLIDALESMKYLKDSNSLVFTGDPASLNKIQSLMPTFDIPGKIAPEKATFYVYKIQHADPQQLENSIDQMSSNLKSSGVPDEGLIDALGSLKYLKDSNSLVFTGDQASLNKIQSLMPTFDIPGKIAPEKATFYVYKIQHADPQQLENSIDQMSSNLKSSGIPDEGLIDALGSVKYLKDSNSLVFTGDQASLNKIQTLMPTFDIPGKIAPEKATFYVYKIQHADPQQLENSIDQMSSNLKSSGVPDEGLIDALGSIKYLKDSNSLVFTGDPASLQKIQTLMPTFDISSGKTAPEKATFFVYKIQHADEEQFMNALSQMAQNLKSSGIPDDGLVDSLQNVKYIKETNSVVFTGDPAVLQKLQTLIPTFDVAPGKVPTTGLPASSQFFIYKPQYRSGPDIQNSLKEIGSNLQNSGLADPSFLRTIDTMKWSSSTNSLTFTGDAASLDRVQTLIKTLDLPTPESLKSTEVFVYKPKYASKEQIETALDHLAQTLDPQNPNDRDLANTIDSMKWLSDSNSFIFKGDAGTIARLKEIVNAMDSPQGLGAAGPQAFFMYQLEHAQGSDVIANLQRVAQNLTDSGLADPALLQTIQSIKWMKDNNSLILTGTSSSVEQVKKLIAGFDTSAPSAPISPEKSAFFIYQLEHVQGDIVLENLQRVSQNLSESGLSDPSLLQTIQNIKWMKDNNTLILTGTPDSVDQVKKIIANFDVGGAPAPAIPGKSSFYIYKPAHLAPDQVQAALSNIGKDLEASGLADPELLDAIFSTRYIPSTESLLITGTPASLEKVKQLIVTIDVPGAGGTQVQRVGNLTFLIYKIQYAPANQLMSSLRSVVTDLENRGTVDKELSDAVSSMKYIKETNSLLFTGTDNGLRKVESLIEKFDIQGLAPKETPPVVEGPPSTFVIYKPEYQSGDELIQTLCDFEQHLIQSGVNDKGLFDAINNLRFIQKTNSLLISGDQASIAKVQELLQKFDIPSEDSTITPSIEAIDNTSFLVYKLQYHQGEEIRDALKQIASTMSQTATNASQSLLNAVNSIQWIKMTNSLLCSGDQTTLTKLKELIQNIDVPLKQVFIEVLVIETALANTQNFGLQWGGKAQYLNKVAAATGNFPTSGSPLAATNGSSQPGSGTFNLSGVSATTTPQAAFVPFVSGFDLGVIGDIIMHKGKSFISLGSLVNALQTDQDSTIVMNPKIITQDNNNSTIFVGNNVPFVGSVVTNSSNNTLNTTSLEYRDIGVSLSITPVLGNGDIVTLDIQNDISELTSGSPTIQAGSVSGIQTSHTSMTTRVHVPDGHFVALSGMIQDIKTHFRSQIPCLGSIPVLGLAFSENDRLNSKANIIIFLRPRIINSFDQYTQITENQEHLFKDSATLPGLKEYFDQGLDLLKTPQDE